MKWKWVIIGVLSLGILFAIFMSSIKFIRRFEDLNKTLHEIKIQTPKFLAMSLTQNDTSIIDLSTDTLVVLHYWATWCKPCIEDFETFQPFYHRHKDSVVFLVITEEPDETVIQFLDKKNYDLPFISSSNFSTPFNFKIQTYPTTLFVRNGFIKRMIIGKTNWDKLNVSELNFK